MPEETFTTGSVQLEEEETQVGHPPLFAVVFFNDDYTPMEFVVYVIQKFFGFDHAKSTEIMLQIHTFFISMSTFETLKVSLFKKRL